MLAAPAAAPRLVPRVIAARDRAAPIIILVSALVHSAALLLFLLRDGRPLPRAPREIPVELVQMPSPARPAPKTPPPPRLEAQATPHETSARRPAAKSLAAKPPAAKSEMKSEAAKSEAAKPKAAESGRGRSGPDVAERMTRLLGAMPTAMPAVAMPGQADDGTEAVSYPQLVLSKLAKAKKDGRHQGIPGRSSVAFSLGVAGQVVAVAVTHPSGDAALDEEAIAMVHRGEPYPPPPPGGQRDYAITLVFRAMP